MSFQIGEVVQLKSGGPKMTVSETNDAGMVMCTWFDPKKVLKKEAFDQSLLKQYKEVIPQVFFGG